MHYVIGGDSDQASPPHPDVYTILNKGIGKGTVITINLNFTEFHSFDDLPDLDFYITSDKNSNGIVLNEWMDGKEEFTFRIEKVSAIQKIGGHE